jgi:pyruvate ferredoxin oxidoreductase beta subunit
MMNEIAEATAYKKIKDLGREEGLFPGTPLCAGCGGLDALRLMMKVLGKKVVFVNAAGCFTILTVYPYDPLHGSWLYTTMGSAPAGAQGIRDALDVLIRKGKLDPEENLDVVVLAGDGSTMDIALSSTSGTLFRNLNYWYICYDNESYANTGVQQSSSTPYGAVTATTPRGVRAADSPNGRKNIFEIWRAHNPPYIATVSPRYAVDLARKFEKARGFEGPKMFIASSPCPTGWLYDPRLTWEVARLAVETGWFPLKESVYGQVSHTYVRKKWAPVEEYLKLQGRFRHLFEPERQDQALKAIQQDIDRYWAGLKAQ